MEETKDRSNLNYQPTFGLSGSMPYGGAFANSIPARVGSAPATDFSVVRLPFKDIEIILRKCF